jgi:hypothetical protein
MTLTTRVEVPRIRGHKLGSRNPALPGDELEELDEGFISVLRNDSSI